MKRKVKELQEGKEMDLSASKLGFGGAGASYSIRSYLCLLSSTSLTPSPPSYHRNCIHRSNMVRSEEIEFEMDEKGERISLGRSEFGNIVVCKYQDKPHTYKEIRPSVVDENNFER